VFGSWYLRQPSDFLSQMLRNCLCFPAAMLDVRQLSVSEFTLGVGRVCFVTSLLYVIFAAARFIAKRRPGDE